MEKEVQERFERIETNLERASERIAQITDAHLELETAQINSQKTHDKLAGNVDGLTERINDLTILVNQLVERDLGRP